jgi:hypothetical protein
VQQHAASFIAHTEASTGAELPRFIKDEFDAFLECGILAHGFLRLRCGECGHDKLLAFSCKRRGFCPSCGARRMSQTAAHLVDHVIPHVPVRQWVLSLPIPLRALLAAQPELVTPVLQVVQRVITRHLLDTAGLRADKGQGGAVTLIQRFGSAANLAGAARPTWCPDLDRSPQPAYHLNRIKRMGDPYEDHRRTAGRPARALEGPGATRKLHAEGAA